MKKSTQFDSKDLITLIDETTSEIAVFSQGKICLVSRSFAHFLGYTKTQLENKELNFIAPHYAVTTLLQQIDSVKKGQEVSISNVELIKKGGHRIKRHISLKRINFDGRAATIIVVNDNNRKKEPASDQNYDKRFCIQVLFFPA